MWQVVTLFLPVLWRPSLPIIMGSEMIYAIKCSLYEYRTKTYTCVCMKDVLPVVSEEALSVSVLQQAVTGRFIFE